MDRPKNVVGINGQKPQPATSVKVRGALPSFVPFHVFTSNHDLETELYPFELVIAAIPNISPLGYEKAVALAYKDGDGNVYSTPLNQHQGKLKDTKENKEFIKNEEAKQNPVRTGQGVKKKSVRGKAKDKPSKG